MNGKKEKKNLNYALIKQEILIQFSNRNGW